MGAYIINVPDTVDTIIYVNIGDVYDGKTYIASQRVEDLTPYTEPDMEKIREEAYEKGKMDAYVEDSKNITVLKEEAEEAYEDGYKTAKVQCNIQAEKDLREVGERHYQKGLSDAWEAARKVTQVRKYGGYGDCLGDVFGRTDTSWDVFDYSAPEAIEKIRQYEQEKEEIKVGDEVINQNKTAVVTEITNRYTRIMYSDGSSYALFAKGLTKTGRHFPEIAAVLEKMKES